MVSIHLTKSILVTQAAKSLYNSISEKYKPNRQKRTKEDRRRTGKEHTRRLKGSSNFTKALGEKVFLKKFFKN